MNTTEQGDWRIITCSGCGKQRQHKAHGKCSTCCSADWRADPNILTHGYGGYSNGCRCETCREAKAAYMRDRRAAAYLNADPGPVPGVTHGTRSAYEERGCRCAECRSAQATSSRHVRTGAA